MAWRRSPGGAQKGALDRIVYTTLIFLAFAVLATRGFNWARFFRANVVLTAFLAYALMSVAWSDFPFISFKRWFRDLGLYVVILVVLSDPKPFEAIGTLHRRLYYLLIPLCILLNKYFPWIAREFDPWTGKGYYMGATTSKNMLGVLCLASGMFFFWDTLIRWKDRKDRRTQRILAVNAAFLAMTLWLMSEAGSATSNVTLVLGCLVIAVAHSATFNRRPMLLAVMIPTGVALYLLLEFGFGINMIGTLAQFVGRSPDLTGRTNIWRVVLDTNTNPLIGVGYESFWLGPRLLWVWERAGGVTEAHNGYLEIYLELGMIGLFLLVAFLIAGYQTLYRRFRAGSSLATLGLAVWTVLLFYNATESGFSPQLMWVIYLLGVITVPGRSERSLVRFPSGARPTCARVWRR